MKFCTFTPFFRTRITKNDTGQISHQWHTIAVFLDFLSSVLSKKKTRKFAVPMPWISLDKVRGRHFFRFFPLKSTSFLMLAFIFGASLTWLITASCKLLIGRLRPNFLAVCQPDWTRVNCSQGYVMEYVCTGNPQLIREARYVIIILQRLLTYRAISATYDTWLWSRYIGHTHGVSLIAIYQVSFPGPLCMKNIKTHPCCSQNYVRIGISSSWWMPPISACPQALPRLFASPWESSAREKAGASYKRTRVEEGGEGGEGKVASPFSPSNPRVSVRLASIPRGEPSGRLPLLFFACDLIRCISFSFL